MKFNQWTLGLAAAGVVSLGSVAQAEEQSALQTALSQTVLSGSISTSVILNPNGNSSSYPGRSFDGATKDDGFNLDHVRLQLERPMAEGEWAAGYKVELLFGDDAALYGTSPGAGTSSVDGDFEGSEVAIKQAYVSLRAPVGNGLDMKVGVWDTIIGYETFNPASNPNYSRSYGYFIEPFAHTGILASYRISDEIAVSAGLANSTSSASTSNQINGRGDGEFRLRYMAAVSYTVPEDGGFLKGSTFYGGFVSSEDGGTAGGPGDGFNVYLGGTMATPVEGLRVGVAFDSAVADNAGDTYVYGLYATFDVSEQMRVSARGEFVDDGGGIIFSGASGQEVISLVGTVDYKLWDNVLTRAEVRWDKDIDGGSGDAFGGQDNQVQLVLNLVYSF
jgi:hypothetical protein